MARTAQRGTGWFARAKKTFASAQQRKALPPSFGNYYQSYMHQPGKPVWSDRAYEKFAEEGYARNVIAHRAIGMIATGAASVKWKLFRERKNGERQEVKRHPLLSLLHAPNPMQGGGEWFENLVAYRLISGNAYVQMVGPTAEAPQELHLLRPDRVQVIAGKGDMPQGYRYTVGNQYTDFPVDRVSGQSRILHWKTFHPLHDWYGLSPVEAAAYSIDQHNQAGNWNQALLQNGARPSGALIVKMEDQGGPLSEDQYWRIKQQIDEQFSGPANAGRPLLLEGGLEWKDMSMSPRDMDFISGKHSAARDIALAFGVPPQLLGIPGDNTYSNLAEARLGLWEQTILPLMEGLSDALNSWLVPVFGNGLVLTCDTDSISALTLRREKVWERIGKADFLTDDEKREMVGLGAKESA